MKKKGTFRVAALLLALVLMTSCFVGGTFAKYVSYGGVSDSARVANWGVTIGISGNLYSDAYLEHVSGAGNEWTGDIPVPAAYSSDEGITVKMYYGGRPYNMDVVAPGTRSNSTGLYLSVEGVPEVSTRFEVSGDAEEIFLKAGTYFVMEPIAYKYLPTDGTTEGNNNPGDFVGEAYTFDGSFYTYSEGKFSLLTAEDFKNLDDSKTYYQCVMKGTLNSDYYPVTYKIRVPADNEDGFNTIVSGKASDVAEYILKQFTGLTFDSEKLACWKEEGSVSFYSDNGSGTKVFAPLTNLNKTIGLSNANIVWQWDFRASDSNAEFADTILGDLITIRNGSSTDGFIPDYKIAVLSTTDEISSIDELVVVDASTNREVRVGNQDGALMAQLETSLEFAITAEQVN